MNDSERLTLLRLFIGALAKLIGEYSESVRQEVPFDPVSFAEAVDEATKQGNKFAERFAVYTTVAGRRCPDFLEGLTLAQSAGLISRQNPTYTSFLLRMAPRQIRNLQCETDFVAAQQLARSYWEHVGPEKVTHATA